MEIIAELKIKILNKLMFSDQISYARLAEVTDNHDLFNYHLKNLLENDYIQKSDKSYILTEKGKQFVSHMEEDGQLQKKFKVGVFIDLVRRNNGVDEILLHKRLKHPNYGYIGVVTGKLKWGEGLQDNINRELQEEIGIKATNYFILGVSREMFLNQQMQIADDGVFFIVVVDKWEGDMRFESQEGEYFWHPIDKVLELDKIFRRALEHGLPRLTKYLNNPPQYRQYINENHTEALDY